MVLWVSQIFSRFSKAGGYSFGGFARLLFVL